MKKIIGIILGIFALLVLSLAISLGQSQFSIISQSQVQLENGEPVWVINIAPTGSGEQILFVNANDMDSYEKDGGLYIPQSDFSISFTPIDNYCEYSLISDQTLTDSIKSFFSDVFGEGYRVYRLGISPESNVNVLVSPSKGDEEIVNLAVPNQIYTFNDNNDGNGIVRMQTLGTFKGITDCPDGGDVAIKYFDDGTFEFVSIERTNTGLYAINTRDSRSDFNQAFEDIKPDINNRFLRGYKDNDYAIGSVLLTADAQYFDVKYIPPSTGKPQIVDTTSPGLLQEGKSAGTSVIVKNVGNGDGRFKITATTDNGYVSPTSQSVDIGKGETEVVFFNVIAGSVEADSESKITYKVCSVNLFTDNFCESEGVFYNIANSGIIPPKADCGDGVCDLSKGETPQTCSADCVYETKCSLEHESLYKGACECDPGYEYSEDVTGRKYCAPIDTVGEWVTILSIALVFVALIGGMVIVYLNKKK